MMDKSREEEKAEILASLEAGHLHSSEIEYALSGTKWDPLAPQGVGESQAARIIALAGLGEGNASAHDYVDYKNARGEEPPEQLVMQPGVEYDPDTGIISVRNATSLANTHRSIEAAGWQKVQGAAHPNPAGAGNARQAGDTAYQLEAAEEMSRIVALAGLDEARLMNAPDGTSMPEPKEYTITSKLGKGAGHKDYGQNRANGQGENPMGMHTADIDSVEEAFQSAMGEYRKFVAENVARKK
jgi:hypothetical protein